MCFKKRPLEIKQYRPIYYTAFHTITLQLLALISAHLSGSHKPCFFIRLDYATSSSSSRMVFMQETCYVIRILVSVQTIAMRKRAVHQKALRV